MNLINIFNIILLTINLIVTFHVIHTKLKTRKKISDLKKQVTKSEEKFSTMFGNSIEMLVIMRENFQISWGNDRWEEVTGYKREDSITYSDKIKEKDKLKIADTIHNMEDGYSDKKECRYKFITKNGNYIILKSIFIKLKIHDEYLIYIISHDITKAMAEKKELNFLAYHDSLTGLYNRKSFYKDAKKLSETTEFTLMYIDLDRFKTINDTLGHEYGDVLLQKTSDRILDCMNKNTNLYRIGGDEFVITLKNPRDELTIVLSVLQIIKSINKPFLIKNKKLYIGASIGIARYPEDAKDIYSLLKNADIAMYDAKKERNKYCFYSKNKDEKAAYEMSLEIDLAKAINENQFELCYQPLIDIKGKIYGAEALLRWNHPTKGTIYPGDFIHLAEEMGYILRIDKWVAEEVIKEIKYLQENKINISIAMNLSARQFTQGRLLDRLNQMLTDGKVDPKYLEFEITEGIMLSGKKSVLIKMDEIRDLGVKLNIDDFGIRYSSLSYLKKFPINGIKIDKHFLWKIPEDEDNMAIIRAFIDLAKTFKLDILSEGVAKKTQLKTLVSLGCKKFQGYLFSKPVKKEVLHKMMTSGKNYSRYFTNGS